MLKPLPMVVETTAGAVLGEPAHAGGEVFRGIPYAEPPVGPLRFRAPEPVSGWNGILDARQFGPEVPQSALSHRMFEIPTDETGSQNYLTLNIWTPDRSVSTHPVMTWIHGGAYKGGGTTSPVYDGGRLAVEGDVVVITVNSRTGMEGFAEIPGSPSNRGLLDLVAAFTWVQENVAAFGGDPRNITIFGQESGAGSVAALLSMAAARGLFHRAIAQSVLGTFLSTELATDVTAQVAKEMQCAPNAVELGKVEPHALAEAAEQVGQRMTQYAQRWDKLVDAQSPFSPVIDGTVLTTDPWRAIETGMAADVPLLTGHTRDENWQLQVPTGQLALVRPASGAKTFLYELVHTVSKNHGALGAAHGSDIPLIFGNFHGGIADRYYIYPTETEVERLGTAMRHAWSRFADTGDPGWDPFTSDERQTMVFDVESSQQRYSHWETLEADDSPKVLTLA